eukprot:1179615-Prorocentrum_minimum.AAC.1
MSSAARTKPKKPTLDDLLLDTDDIDSFSLLRFLNSVVLPVKKLNKRTIQGIAKRIEKVCGDPILYIQLCIMIIHACPPSAGPISGSVDDPLPTHPGVGRSAHSYPLLPVGISPNPFSLAHPKEANGYLARYNSAGCACCVLRRLVAVDR